MWLLKKEQAWRTAALHACSFLRRHLLWLPDLCSFVIATRDDVAAVGRPGYGVNAIGVTLIGEDMAPIQGIPDLYRIIPTTKGCSATGGDALTIGRPCLHL